MVECVFLADFCNACISSFIPQTMMKPYFLPKRQKRKLIEDRIRTRDETNRLKRVLVLQRRTRVSVSPSRMMPSIAPSID